MHVTSCGSHQAFGAHYGIQHLRQSVESMLTNVHSKIMIWQYVLVRHLKQ